MAEQGANVASVRSGARVGILSGRGSLRDQSGRVRSRNDMRIGENDRLVGMVTDRDIVCKGLAQDNFDASGATARDVMTAEIH